MTRPSDIAALRRAIPVVSNWLFVVAAALLLAVVGCGPALPPTGDGAGTAQTLALPVADRAAQASVDEAYGRLPLMFEANQGQTDSQVQFLAKGSGYSLSLMPGQTVLSLHSAVAPDGAGSQATEPVTVRMTLVGSNSESQLTGHEEQLGRVSYLLGNDSAKWRTGIPTYARVQQQGVYPGVDVVYYGNQRQLEYDFVVAPGADPQTIALSFDAGVRLELDGQGDLVLHSAAGQVHLSKPVVYQEVEGLRQEVSASYLLKGLDGVGFEVGTYDTSRPLVIDPVLSYATYLGGGGNDQGAGIAVDGSGNAYVTGRTDWPGLPTTTNVLQPSIGGAFDSFVAKLSPTGSLLYLTYLGGTGNDYASGIALDVAGSAYVVGASNSTDFPTRNAVQSANGGSYDAFVTKLDAAGSAIVYSTYLGGGDLDWGTGIAVDSAGSASVVGQAQSSGFPVANAVQPVSHGVGGAEAFVAKLNPSGSALVFSTYLGGSRDDIARGVDVDASGNIYVTGETQSLDFPTTSNALQPSPPDYNNAFVAKLSPTGSALVYSTYLGGSTPDVAYDIAVDASGNAYVTGYTTSDDFPITANAAQPTSRGWKDGYVSKIDAQGSALVYSTFIGYGNDQAQGIAVDAAGAAHVTGMTWPFILVVKLNSDGTAFVYSWYFSSGTGSGNGIGADASGNAYFTGYTDSGIFATAGALQSVIGGGQDAFIAKLTQLNSPPTASAGGPYSVSEGGSGTLTGAGSDPDGGPLTYAWDLDNNGSFEASGQSVTFSAATLDGPASRIATLRVTDNAGVAATAQATINISNVPPTISSVTNTGPINEGAGASVAVVATDPAGAKDPLLYAFDCDKNGVYEIGPQAGATAGCTFADNGSSQVDVRVTDDDGGAATASTVVTVNNVAPTVGPITAPLAPMPVNTPINASASFTDPGVRDTHAATWTWGDGGTSAGTVTETNGSGAVSGSKTYTASGVYSLTLTVTDKDGASSSSVFQYVVVYDPSGGFVTGAGVIDSPSGAYASNPLLVGQAIFGFVAKYQPGATTPSGNTMFRFQLASLAFSSTSYEWLVVSGARAQFKGSGTINGSGDYGFLLTATDGQVTGGNAVDKFRIKIWDKATGNMIYDNQVGGVDTSDAAEPVTAIAAGNIVVQK